MRAYCGFAMIEVLVTILILSFGLLGLAGLQATGLSNNYGSHMRSIATIQTYELIDRMRANRSGVESGYYNSLGGTPSSPGCIATATGCSPANIAITDIYEWNTRNAQLLPSGVGLVCLDSTPTGGTPAAPGCDGSPPFVVKIWWDGNKDTTNLSQLVTPFEP